MTMFRTIAAAALLTAAPLCQSTEVIMAGGVALKSWEHLRGPVAHDNWWANFVRASTICISAIQAKNPQASIVWIVYRPAYVTRGKEEGKDYVRNIRETAAKYKVKLVWADTAEQACRAVNKAAPVTSFYYFGHSTAHAMMLDYSNDIIAASTQWIHEKDIGKLFRKEAFAPNAYCISYGCYTGNSMSASWQKALGLPLWGNTESTRYYPVGDGKFPEGGGKWVH
ncbi:MAG: hypothetical protein ACI4OX_00995 [Akkermansia sp.]